MVTKSLVSSRMIGNEESQLSLMRMERGDVLGEHVKSRLIVQIVVGLVAFRAAKELVYWVLQAGGRRYPVLSCKGVEIVHHEEWSS